MSIGWAIVYLYTFVLCDFTKTHCYCTLCRIYRLSSPDPVGKRPFDISVIFTHVSLLNYCTSLQLLDRKSLFFVKRITLE